jgi:hypothetical protein
MRERKKIGSEGEQKKSKSKSRTRIRKMIKRKSKIRSMTGVV